ncbi:MAG: hypothetical protein D6726_11920 [Nitrospirae bacterium]|nr:MAG: hypothetical protein D6726_11920 [Nitrospirota bacterium]
MRRHEYLMSLSGVIALLCISIVLFSCAVNPVTGKKELMLLSEEAEINWGHQMYPSALWGEVGGGGVYHDPELEGYLEGIVKRLHRVSHRPNLPVDFVIQNSSVPNAWAIPGHVAITRGLLAELESEAEFAFVMGHEMGHVAARHSARHYTSQVLVGGLLAGTAIALSGSKNADLYLGLGAIGSSLLLLKYSRDDELEADRLGVEYMRRAGYQPREALTAHRRLEGAVRHYLERVGKKSRGGDFLSELFSTHPRTRVRLSEIEKLLPGQKMEKTYGDGVNRALFLSKTARLRKVDMAYHDYDRALVALEKKDLERAESLVKSAIRKNPDQAPFYNLLGNIELRRERYRASERQFRKALEKDSGYQPAYEGLGMARFFEHDYNGAIRYLEKSLQIFPGNPVSSYYAGLSYFELGNYSRAIAYLRDFERAAPSHKRVHGYLGIAYEKTGDYRSAYREYNLQVKVDPYSDLGRHARERLMVLKPIVRGRGR